MANKLKSFLFPSRDENEMDSTTIVIKKEKISDMDNTNNNVNANNINQNTPNIFTPTAFFQSESIANELLAGKSVIVDLTSTELSIAKRICDFLNGVTFALNGNVNKIAKLVYLFAPNTSK